MNFPVFELTSIRRSRRSTPWDGIDRTPLQLHPEQLRGCLETNTPFTSRSNESDLINSIMPTKCPYYSVEIITRIDMTEGGIQRYLCKQ